MTARKLILAVALTVWPSLATEQAGNQEESLEHAYNAAKALTPSDIPKVQNAAEGGDIRQQVLLGTAYRRGDSVPVDDEKAFYWLRKAADRGSAVAQIEVAILYSDGKGVERNDAEAMRWLRKAANQGNPDAMGFIGTMYETGQGVPVDVAEAVKWYRQGAERGASAAQRFLGDMYATGKGVPQDYTEAANWYRKAAAQGDPEARKALMQLDRTQLIDNPLRHEVGPGETSPGLYKNEYLGLTFHFPPDWRVLERGALDAMEIKQAQSARAQFGALPPSVTRVPLPSALLFAAEVPGHTGAATSNVMFSVEHDPFIHRAEQYFANRAFLSDASASGKRGPDAADINGIVFYRADRWRTSGRRVYQVRLVTLVRSIILMIDILAENEASTEEPLKALNGLKIASPAQNATGREEKR